MMTTRDEPQRPRRLRWRLRVMMAERDVRTITDLTRRLGDIGVEISTQQMNRIANDLPQRLPTNILAGLVTVLKCEVGDLLVAEPMMDDRPTGGHPDRQTLVEPAPTPKRRRRSPPAGGDDGGRADGLADLVGPQAVLFPVPSAR